MIASDDAPGLFGPFDEARPPGLLLTVWEQGEWVSWSWDDWRRAAFRFAGSLRLLGVNPGDRVACLLENSSASCAAVLGTWLAGACLVSLPGLARGMSAELYVAMLRRIVAQSSPSVVLAQAETAGLLGETLGPVRVHTLESLRGGRPVEGALPDDGEPVFVQYSSGSTSEPRGCELSARAVAWQLDRLAAALEVDPERDVSLDWLPLSHDMGLFGCLLMTAYFTGTRQVLSSPQRFIAGPHSWFTDLATFGATITSGPNFALELAARFASLLPDTPIPLNRLVLGGERINPDTLDRACDALGPHRLPRTALLPAYGMAEAVLAVTTAPCSEGPRLIACDRNSLADGTVSEPAGRTARDEVAIIPSVGLPLPGNTIDILGYCDVGEIRLRSPSLASRYFRNEGLTGERFTTSGFLTGDIGFVRDGQLHITGRTDELLVLAGRNVYALDIERAVLATGAVRPGSCAAVQLGEDSDPRLVIVAEPADERAELSLLAETIAHATKKAAGITVAECVFLDRGRFPKTPSGKVQRFRCRELAAGPIVDRGKRIANGRPPFPSVRKPGRTHTAEVRDATAA